MTSRTEVLQVQVNMIFLRPYATTLANFDGHRTTDNVARRQVLGVRRVALHEALAVRIGQVATLAAHAFGDQAAGAINAGRMKLHELHVLHAADRRATPSRCRRRCRCVPRCRKNRNGRSRQSRE